MLVPELHHIKNHCNHTVQVFPRQTDRPQIVAWVRLVRSAYPLKEDMLQHLAPMMILFQAAISGSCRLGSAWPVARAFDDIRMKVDQGDCTGLSSFASYGRALSWFHRLPVGEGTHDVYQFDTFDTMGRVRETEDTAENEAEDTAENRGTSAKKKNRSRSTRKRKVGDGGETAGTHTTYRQSDDGMDEEVSADTLLHLARRGRFTCGSASGVDQWTHGRALNPPFPSLPAVDHVLPVPPYMLRRPPTAQQESL